MNLSKNKKILHKTKYCLKKKWKIKNYTMCSKSKIYKAKNK